MMPSVSNHKAEAVFTPLHLLPSILVNTAFNTGPSPLTEGEMSAFTCITCRVAFADADLQRAHYKADWHRYNLKRKVADMPPVTADNFQARVLSQKAQVGSCTSDFESKIQMFRILMQQ